MNVIIAFALLAGGQIANAKLRATPEIRSVTMDPANPDMLYLQISFFEKTIGVSTNGGWTFQTISRDAMPTNTTSKLHFQLRRYALIHSEELLRSDDGGLTWTNTAAAKFLRAQTKKLIEQEIKSFQEESATRLPDRSSLWNPVFAAFAIFYCLLAAYVMRKEEGLWFAINAVTKGVLILFIFWCLLTGFHIWVRWQTNSQWPGRFWNTSSEFNPSFKTGVIMAIAAQPLPLMLYLIALWWVLPGSSSALAAISGTCTAKRKQNYHLVSTIVGIAFLIFHLIMVFVGFFLE
jgi:hypothetical protein